MNDTIIRTQNLSAIEAWVAAALAPGPGSNIGLFSNDYTPVPTTVLGDLTPADFSGYAEVSALESFTTSPNTDGSASSNPAVIASFAQTAVTISQIVYGWYMTTGAGVLVAAGQFDTPINFNAIGVSVQFVLVFNLGVTGFTVEAIIIP